jgi:hypothetical protein
MYWQKKLRVDRQCQYRLDVQLSDFIGLGEQGMEAGTALCVVHRQTLGRLLQFGLVSTVHSRSEQERH